MEDNVDSGVESSGEASSPEMEEMLAEISSSVFPDKADENSTDEGVTDESKVEEKNAATTNHGLISRISND